MGIRVNYVPYFGPTCTFLSKPYTVSIQGGGGGGGGGQVVSIKQYFICPQNASVL